MVIFETFNWIWCLIVVSDKINIEHPWFHMARLETYGDWYIFCATMGLFTGVNAIAGHELLHRREWYHKMAGTWAYSKFFYSSFINEHVEGHHKLVATPEDPATARKNEPLYTFICRSLFGSHRNTWNREAAKIKKKFGKETTLLHTIVLNKMTFYFIFHVSILGTILLTLGLRAAKYQLAYAA